MGRETLNKCAGWPDGIGVGKGKNAGRETALQGELVFCLVSLGQVSPIRGPLEKVREQLAVCVTEERGLQVEERADAKPLGCNVLAPQGFTKWSWWLEHLEQGG